MKKIQPKEMILLLISLSFQANVFAQITTPTNGFGAISTDYVGWDQFQTWPLEIRHDGIDYPIELYTNQPGASFPDKNMRMKIWRDQITIPNGLTNYEVGRVGILSSLDGWSLNPRPVSLLHLGTGIDGNGNSGYRKWMDI